MEKSASRTRILAECALMVAISAILQIIPPLQMPQGGTITFGAMVPIVFIALYRGVKWGLLTAFVGSLIQMMLGGISAPPTETVFWFLLVILLDYVVAYTVLGLAPVFAAPLRKKHPLIAAGVGSVCVTLLRYACHWMSGIFIWSIYAPADQPVWLYSLIYNGTFMVPETITTAVLVVVLWKFIVLRKPVQAVQG